MAIHGLLCHLLSCIRLIFITTPHHSPWTSLVLLIVRLLTFSIILRTYVVPWGLRLLFHRFRVRSVSLRSIRGIYFRQGLKTWRIDRIGLSYHRRSGSVVSRLTIKVEGLNLEIAKRSDELEDAPVGPRMLRRMPTLADFAPSPMAHRLRLFAFAIYARGEPYFRPLIRSCFVAALRLLIQCLPALTQVFDFELDSAVLKLEELPGVLFSFKEMLVSTKIVFSQVEKVAFTQTHSLHRKHRRFLSVIDWRSRLTSSVKRTWARAWGNTQGTVSVSVKFSELSGKHTDFRHTTTIFCLPCSQLNASVDINSYRGIEPHSLDTAITLDSIAVSVDSLQSVVAALKRRKRNAVCNDYGVNAPEPLTSPTSPSKSSFSPSIPFMKAFTNSPMSISRGPLERLKAVKAASSLSSIRKIQIQISNVNLGFGLKEGKTESHKLNLRQFSVVAGLSNGDDNIMHRDLLGRSTNQDGLDQDVYMANCSLEEIILEGNSRGIHLNSPVLATVGRIYLNALGTQWPTSWMSNSSFISGDPNAALVALRLKVTRVDITQDWKSIQEVLVRSKPPSTDAPVSINMSPLILSSVPRVSVELEVGQMRANLPYSEKSNGNAVEMHTNGLVLSVSSHFSAGDVSRLRSQDIKSLPFDTLPVRMHTNIGLLIEPIHFGVRVNSCPQSEAPLSPSDGIILPLESVFESVLTIDALELTGSGATLASVSDGNSIALDVSSTFVNLHCVTDALSVELWHPEVISTISMLMDILSQKKATKAPRNPAWLTQLSLGICATLAIARFTIFVTNPDLNPREEMNISRGLAFHSGFSAQYCAILPLHIASISDMSVRAQTRQKLYLPEERIMDAVSRARHTQESHWTADVVRVSLWDTGLRSAVATSFVADDPYSMEELSFVGQNREFLTIPRIRVDLVYPGVHASEHFYSKHEALVEIPSIRFKLELVHIYSLLLAVQALKSMSSSTTRSEKTSQSGISPVEGLQLNLRVAVQSFELLFKFPTKQSICTRINTFNVRTSPSQPTSLHWDTWNFWVPRPRRKDEGGLDDLKWEEFGCLRDWNVHLEHSTGSISITMKGDTGRVRIPHQFVLADLVLSIILTIKSARHLVKLVPTAKFAEMNIPVAEGPKTVPKITFEVHRLIAEAADDPFESKLALISHAGSRASEIMRTHREAFDAKVAAILAADSPSANESDSPDETDGYQFSSKHSVTIEEAHQRLLHVHSQTWREVHKVYHQRRDVYDQTTGPTLKARRVLRPQLLEATLIRVEPIPSGPPLLRITIKDLHLRVGGPSYPLHNLPDFLHEQGSGQPRNTEYFLLIPLHLSLSMASLQATLRDYPLPLLSIHASPAQEDPALTFNSDLVIAEQTGTPHSVEWRNCVVVEQHFGIQGASPFSFSVPKTIMPVKMFAKPIIRVLTQQVTDICCGVSYSPAIQDVMRVVETLSSAPRDPSPPLGFWDKIRLVFHSKIIASFEGDVHFHMKGSRNPYNVLHNGAGFALCWSGNPKILIGQENEDDEQIQVISDTMSVIIPNFEKVHELSEPSISVFDHRPQGRDKSPFTERHICELRKTCAKLGSGVRFGVRFDLERTCGSDCLQCTGPAYRRKCRMFTFRPHYDIRLERGPNLLAEQASTDSYQGFRSDFIHMSISLTSAVRRTNDQPSFSSFHLTPKAFAQFWHWWDLFDGRLSLPIRQGSYYRHKLVSPKFGRHLATIKYRISIPHLFISHAYIDESRQAWSDGITRFVGVKALIDHFQADMHQRDQESTQFNPLLDATEVVRHKPFNAAEVVLKGLDLRAMLATFADPVKKIIFPEPCPGMSKDRIRSNLPVTDSGSIWIDSDDFVEIDWHSSDTPKVNLLRSSACPHFTYFKRSVETDCRESHQRTEYSKFGNEDTHVCSLGKESTAPQIQIDLVSARIKELQKTLSTGSADGSAKMIGLLEDYVVHLGNSDTRDTTNYYMAADTIRDNEWSSFNNVYHVHCPKLFLSESVRDILMAYYYCSRSRRGFEYHLATRAVKFIRDQDLLRDQSFFGDDSTDDHQSPRSAASVAQAAVQALRKSLNREYEPEGPANILGDALEDAPLPELEPLEGWSQGVSLKRSHFCVLLKPQIVLHSETSTESNCVVAAGVAKLQVNEIMDNSNVDDPICGKIMSRTYNTLNGVQIFAPSKASLSADGCVPVEVLIDFRCESRDFDRLVPQTEATIRYDKFNRLRLRNNSVTSNGKANSDNAHLQHQTDLLNIHVPRFTVSASDEHFAAISDIVNKLLLFSDAAHKTRLDRLETLLFSYDFTDLTSSASVVSDLQARLREGVEQEQAVQWRLRRLGPSDDQVKMELAKIRADVLALADELSYVFEAIRLAQDKTEGNSDQKSALLLLAFSQEMSWRMLDARRELLAKLSVKNVKFSWLSRQDSSIVSRLRVGDLHAFDGSATATWSEILRKHSEPSNHPLVKRDLFALSNWTVLAPVGGISIYENFEVLLHPICLQLDTKVGQRIMEYIWPARKHRKKVADKNSEPQQHDPAVDSASPLSKPHHNRRQRPPSLDLQSPKHRKSLDSRSLSPGVAHRLGASRSFTDLRSTALGSPTSTFHKNHSTDALSSIPSSVDTVSPTRKAHFSIEKNETSDAAEMRNRSSQNMFVSVDIASLHLLLNIMKEGSFLVRNARISTHDLQYRNQVWSLEQLVDQFIPSNSSWKGWMKMAFHQPFFDVFPVARELISKTKRIASKGSTPVDHPRSTKKSRLPYPAQEIDATENNIPALSRSTRIRLVADPDPVNGAELVRHPTELAHRPRILSIFRRNTNNPRISSPVPPRSEV